MQLKLQISQKKAKTHKGTQKPVTHQGMMIWLGWQQSTIAIGENWNLYISAQC
jgi:hypothetical protein